MARRTARKPPVGRREISRRRSSIQVDDVDAVHDRAVASGAPVVYPLTDEPWGLRRFFLRDRNGAIINVTLHPAG